MSTYHHVVCLACEVEGPSIANGTAHHPDAWAEFLTEHEWCPVVLAHEAGPRPITAAGWLAHPALPRLFLGKLEVSASLECDGPTPRVTLPDGRIAGLRQEGRKTTYRTEHVTWAIEAP